jgi:hypothetical protein
MLIKKCLPDVSSNFLMNDVKSDERWKAVVEETERWLHDPGRRHDLGRNHLT